MRTTPVLSFMAKAPNKVDIEADLAMFWQESLFGEKKDGLLFAECKMYNKFVANDFARMRYLASMFPGAVLVFSTLRKSLSKEEIQAINKIARAGRKYWKAERPINPVLILTGTELLSWRRPPYCWDDPSKERFQHLHGLVDLCNATQQLYLGLPSWSDDWHKRWEARNKRRAKANSGGPSK